MPGDALDGQLDLKAGCLPDGRDDLLGHGHDILLRGEAHLDIKLGELRLAIGSEVLVTVATGYLVVPLEPADHQQLLQELGGLRQGIPGTGRQAGRHQEVTGTLRSGLDQGGRLDFAEVHIVQGGTGGLVHLGPESNRLLHGGPAQVEIAVPEADILTGKLVLGLVLQGRGDLERQGIGLGKHRDGIGHDLDMAGGEMVVVVAFGPGPHHSLDLDDELAPKGTGDLFVVDDDLDQT